MPTEGGLLAERPVAHLAAVRFDTCVRTLVINLEAFPDESFIAVAAFVRFDSSMGHFMALSIGVIRKCLFTVSAWVWLFTSVCSHMVLEMDLRLERLLAHLALERLTVRVGQHVHL